MELRANSPAAQTTIVRFTALLLPVALGAYLLITSTTDLSDTMWQFDAKRMLQLYLLPCMFLWVLIVPSLRIAFSEQVCRIPRWIRIALALMFLLGVISAWHNSTSRMGLAYSLADVALLFLLIPAALVIAACRNVAGEGFDRIVIVLIAMVGIAVGLQELIGVLAALNAGVEFNPRIALQHFSWPRFYNQVQSWTMPAIAALPFVFPRKRLVWLFCLLALSLHWYVVIATGGRATAVSVVGAVTIAAVLWPLARKRLLAINAVGLLLGILVYALVLLGHWNLSVSRANQAEPNRSGIESSQSTQQENTGQDSAEEDGKFISAITGDRMKTSSGRTEMWRGSIQDTKAHPWLGIGPMNYACKGPVYRAAHPHSFPIQFLSEWGIPAFLLMLSVALFIAFRLVITLRAEKRTENGQPVDALQLALATSLISAAICACLDGVLIMPASLVAGILMVGWIIGTSGTATPQFAQLPARKVTPIIFLVFALAISLLFLSFARQEIAIHEQSLEATPLMDRLIPRLWQNGKVCAIYQDAAQTK